MATQLQPAQPFGATGATVALLGYSTPPCLHALSNSLSIIGERSAHQ